MSPAKSKSPWHHKVNNPAQIGGIETSVLDNGLARNTRIAWINTGTGLRYKVVIDRGLDIVDAFYNQHSLAWHSHAGVVAPTPDANRDIEWLSSFGGGLLSTCGMTHVGPPETDEFGKRGIHGRFSNTPAILESIVQPDPVAGKLDMSITATIKQSRMFGPNLEMKRTISGRLGEPVIRIHDVITNYANTPAPLMVLYHCNYGWPLVDKGTQIIWRGSWSSRGRDIDSKTFNDRNDFKTCPAPIASHKGAGEGCGFIDVTADSKGLCHVGLYNPKLKLALAMTYSKKQMPCLTNWQHWGPGEYVTGIEPGNCYPVGQGQARRQKTLKHLAPGKSKTFNMEIAVLTREKQIKQFLKYQS